MTFYSELLYTDEQVLKVRRELINNSSLNVSDTYSLLLDVHGGACGVGNGHGDTSSNLGRD